MGSWQFEDVMKALSKNYRVIGVDLAGMGGAEAIESPSLEAFSKFLENFVNHFKLKEFSLVGHSTGGVVALLYAYDHPDKLDKMILSSTPWRGKYLFGGNWISPVINFAKNELIWEIVRFFIRLRYNFSPDRDLAKLSKEIRKKKLKSVLASDKDTLIAILSDLAKCDFREKVRTIKTWTLIVDGDSSGIVKNEASKELAAIMPRAKIKIFKDCGHSLPLEKPEEFAGAIKEFVGA